MHERMVGMARRTRWVAWVGLALVAVLAAVWLVVSSPAPPAQAADPKETPTSSGTSTPQTIDDCFGGALSEDPIHCSVLQLAHNEGIMEVDAVYRAGTSLYLYLAQSERVSDEVYDYIRSKAREEVARRGGRACKYGYYGCDIGVLGAGLLPVSKVYSEIELRGGADGRRSHGGWAAYRQLWPVVSSDGTRGGSSGTTAASSFDVSDVDTKNFPEFQSRWHEPLKGLGLAGWHSGGDKAYVQVKAPPGQEANATAAKEAVIRQNPRLNDDNVVIIPVKYDYEEYWRWSVILDRFAVSSGNTIGILWSRVDENRESYPVEGEAVYPLPELPEAVRRPGAMSRHPEDLRTTLHVMTYELHRTVDALPVLLPLLGIPVDAVGVVVEYRPRPFAKPVPLPGVSSSARPAQSEAATETASTPTESVVSEVVPDATESVSEDVDEPAPAPAVAEPAVSEQGVSPWLLFGGGGAVAIAALALGVLIGLRRAGRRV